MSQKLGITLSPTPDLTLSKLLQVCTAAKFIRCCNFLCDPLLLPFFLCPSLQLGLEEKLETIQGVSDVAGKEFQLERALNAMADDWKTLIFDHSPYRYASLVSFLEFVNRLY